jgi:hypothetical protein
MSPLVLALFVFIVYVNAKVFSPVKGVSRLAAFEQYNKFWNKSHSSAAEKNARFLNFMVCLRKKMKVTYVVGKRQKNCHHEQKQPTWSQVWFY